MHVHFKSPFFQPTPHAPYLPFITWRGGGGEEGGAEIEGSWWLLELEVYICACVFGGGL